MIFLTSLISYFATQSSNDTELPAVSHESHVIISVSCHIFSIFSKEDHFEEGILLWVSNPSSLFPQHPAYTWHDTTSRVTLDKSLTFLCLFAFPYDAITVTTLLWSLELSPVQCQAHSTQSSNISQCYCPTILCSLAFPIYCWCVRCYFRRKTVPCLVLYPPRTHSDAC